MARKSQKSRAVQSRKKKNRTEKRSRHLNRLVATDSAPPNALDTSIAESFAQLDLSDQMSDGPISRLPNELVQSILALFEIQKLLHLQVVCKKWQAVICSIGHNKKALFFRQPLDLSYFWGTYVAIFKRKIDSIKERSFGHIDLNAFTNIKVKPNSTELSQSQFVSCFPNVESFVMNLRLSNIVTVLNQLPLNQLTTLTILNTFVRHLNTGASNDYLELLTLINSCLSLKRLDIRIVIDSQLPILAPTFARLELFSYSSYEPTLIGHFDPKCSQVSLSRFGEDINFDQWHTINGQWLANVTHLHLKNVRKHDRVIEYLSQHAVSLQVLCLDTDYYYQITSQVIGHLSKLKHLTEIELSWVSLDTPQLEEAARKFELIPLVSIRSFTLANSSLDAFSGENTDRFTKILCIFLPNVQKLNFMCNRCFLFPYDDIEQYLHRFPKLRTVLISSGTITIPQV